MSDRRCVICGEALEGRRRDAVTCSAGCRRELGRYRAVQAGKTDGPYATVEDLANRRQRRAKPIILGESIKWGRDVSAPGPVTHGGTSP